MSQSKELTERIEHIRDLTPLNAAEELVKLSADDIQFILSRTPVRQLLRKEILLGALNGAAFGVIAGIAMFAYALSTDASSPAML